MIMARERLGFRGMVNRGGRGFGRNVILLLVGYGLALPWGCISFTPCGWLNGEGC